MKLSEKMYNLNANLSALVYIQKVKTKEEAVEFLQTINREIAKWIKESREMESPNIDVKCLCGKNLVGSQSSPKEYVKNKSGLGRSYGHGVERSPITNHSPGQQVPVDKREVGSIKETSDVGESPISDNNSQSSPITKGEKKDAE